MCDFFNFLNDIKNNHTVHKPVYKCEKCKDTTWITWDDADGHSIAKRCSCYSLRQIESAKARSEIPTEFLTKSFENFYENNDQQLSFAKSKAQKYADDFFEIEKKKNNSIIFCGQVGSGKTHLATAICNELANKGIFVKCMYYRSAITDLKQLIGDHDAYDSEFSKYKNARILLIDDFLKGKVTEADVNIVYDLIDWRYSNSLPSIITTEKNLNEILDFDEAIGGRIVEMCKQNILLFEGKKLDYRVRR